MSALGVAELAGSYRPVEVGKRRDLEELSAGSGTKRVELLAQSSFESIKVHEGGR